MALDKDILGQALYDARAAFNEKTMDQLLAIHGDIETARLAACKIDADVIINHIKQYAEGKYQAGTLIAGANAVTAVGVTIPIKIN
jgi:hypothetical protein